MRPSMPAFTTFPPIDACFVSAAFGPVLRARAIHQRADEFEWDTCSRNRPLRATKRLLSNRATAA